MSTTIQAGGRLVLDPSDKRLVEFDWDTTALPSGVQISTSSFTITAVRQQGVTALTKDNEGFVSGSTRQTQVRLLATTATAGDSYYVSNKIVTDETPAQEIERRVLVVIRDR